MAAWCPPADETLNTCDPLAAPTAAEEIQDRLPYRVAVAIQAAAMEILALSGTDCHTDGGVDWGDPSMKCSGGAVMTGILTPQAPEGSDCFGGPEYEYRLMVTWEKSRHSVDQVAVETNRLWRLLSAQTCCLIKATGTWSAPGVTVVATANSNADLEDVCPYLNLILRTT